jgi:iron complex outermembrane receptor protein
MPMQLFEAGFARKSRSPNLYQRYLWSTQPMAMLMNNFVGDGNGYVGNLDLKPEVAHTVSASGDWHDAEQKDWRCQGHRLSSPMCRTTSTRSAATSASAAARPT